MTTPGRSRREVSADVPGKRSESASSKSSKSAKSVYAVSKPKPRPAQPFKRPGRLGSSQGGLSPSVRPSKTPRTGSPCSTAESRPQTLALSLLEMLPVEVLEQIFLYSLNPNFALASPVLAATVSRERIYRALILLAFWCAPPTPDERRSRHSVITHILGPVEHIWISYEDRARLQETILRCKWCTLQRVRAQLGDLTTLTTYCHAIDMDAPKNDAVDASRMQRVVRRDVPPLSLLKFPPHLLQGAKQGFSDDDVTFLEMLRMCSGSFYDPNIDNIFPHISPSLDRDALQLGIQKALHQRNLDALVTLLKIDESFVRTDRSFANRREFYTIPPEHFVTATRVSPNDTSFFLALFRASAESVPADDEAITQWALDLIAAATTERNDSDAARNAAFAQWLFDWMLQLPQQISIARRFPADQQLFFRGRLNVHPLTMARRLNVHNLVMARRLMKFCPEAWLEDWLLDSPFRTDEGWVFDVA